MIYQKLFLSLLFFPLTMFAQNTWTPEKEENSIKAFSRFKQGKDYYEYRTIFTVNEPIHKVAALIGDVSNFKNWMPNTVQSRILKIENDSTFYAYTETSAPWPASNRDAVFKASRRQKGNTITFLFEGKSNYIPEQKGKVRVKDYFAQWRLIQLGPNKTQIEYIGSFDPGKSYPNWMVKNSIIDARIESSKKLIQALKRKS